MATSEVQIENEHLRVTKWTIEPGGSIPFHRHDNEYVVVPLSDGHMYAIDAHGAESKVALTVGVSYARSSGVEHAIENRSQSVVVFVEIERL